MKTLITMRKRFISFFIVIVTFIECGAQTDNTQYIDPTIGNVSKFLVPTYPTMHLPNQMLRMFPIKKDYLADQVEAFPLQVTSHRSKGLFHLRVANGEIQPGTWERRMTIDHDLEIVKPWLYSTYLIDDEITVSFSPGKKAAIYKLEFPPDGFPSVLISGSNELKCSVNENVSFSLVEQLKYRVRGVEPTVISMPVYVNGQILDESGAPFPHGALEKTEKGLVFRLTTNENVAVFVRYAVSYISPEQAEFNFSKELKNTSFEDLAARGKVEWERVVNQIQVKGGTEAQRRTFYSALYRTYERMVDINEYGQYYSGYDGAVHKSTRPFYVDDWVWDTYLAHHPLRTILNPALESEMLNSYTLMYEQSGWMPTFPQVYRNHMCMNSYHSSGIFLDAYRKGLEGYDVEKAYEGIRKNLTEGTFIPWRQGTPRLEIDDFYHENGYFPSLSKVESETIAMVDGFEKRQPVSVTLGISYDFWALSELARDLRKKSDYIAFAPKVRDYQNLWHPEHRLFMPRDSEGKWVDINPKLDGGLGYREYYDENNGWTYAWDVKHDIPGLIDLLGGKKKTEERLDQLFREPLEIRKSQFYVNGSNSTGMVGQFSMGNEPSFHIPYLYNYVGAPWKTQKRTRFLLDVWFKDTIFGIPGDEDGGGMTAWVVFSSMGLYPVVPGLPYYTITSPIFEEVRIRLMNGKEFTVIARGSSKEKKYIQKAWINGQEIDDPFISHEQVMAGATLEVELGELPNKAWGMNAKVPQFD